LFGEMPERELGEMPEVAGNSTTNATATGGGEQSQGQTPGQPQGDTGQQSTALTYDSWLGSQPEDVKTLVEHNIQGLKSALQSERQQRQQLADQLRDAAKGVTGEAKTALDKLSSDLEAAQLRADFFEDAAKPDVGCTNPRLAFIAAEQAGLINKKGQVNWPEMRAQYPELFRQASPAGRGSADGGAGGKRPTAASMNDYIRKAAGR
jgi:hypothetical protein